MSIVQLTADHGYVFFVAIGFWLVNQILGNLVHTLRRVTSAQLSALLSEAYVFMTLAHHLLF